MDMDSSIEMDRHHNFSDDDSSGEDEIDESRDYDYDGEEERDHQHRPIIPPFGAIFAKLINEEDKHNETGHPVRIRGDTPPWRRLADPSSNMSIGLGLHSYDSNSLPSFNGTQINDLSLHSPPGAPTHRRFRDWEYTPNNDDRLFDIVSQSQSEASYVPFSFSRPGISRQGLLPNNPTALSSSLERVETPNDPLYNDDPQWERERTSSSAPVYNPVPLATEELRNIVFDLEREVQDKHDSDDSDMDASASEDGDDHQTTAHPRNHNHDTDEDSSASDSHSELGDDPYSLGYSPGGDHCCTLGDERIYSPVSCEYPYSPKNELAGLPALNQESVSVEPQPTLVVTVSDDAVVATTLPASSVNITEEASDWDFTPPPQAAPTIVTPLVAPTHILIAESDAASAYFTPPPEVEPQEEIEDQVDVDIVDATEGKETAEAQQAENNAEFEPAPAALPIEVSDPIFAANSRKRSREDDSEEPELPQASSSCSSPVDSIDPNMAMIVDAPALVDETTAPSPRAVKRARLSSSAAKGFVAGAVAGSALTWAGLAFL